MLRAGHASARRRSCQAAPQRAAAPARQGALRVRALDAAMPFDFESRARQRLAEASKLTVGIVGFGTFGQFLARRLVQAGHTVRAARKGPFLPRSTQRPPSFQPSAGWLPLCPRAPALTAGHLFVPSPHTRARVRR